MLPLDGDDTDFSVIAVFDPDNSQEVYWGYSQITSPDIKNPIELPVPEHGEYQYVVTRGPLDGNNTSVFVEACGWYDPKFKFRVELTTDNPDLAVMLATAMGKLMP